MFLASATLLFRFSSSLHPPPAVCCEGEVAPVTWAVNGSSPGVWCSQMLYSAENYMGCAALLSCERRGQEIWLTCPDGYEPDCVTGCVPFEKDCPENDVDLISWVRNHGGFVDERLVIRDGDHGRGLFAKDGAGSLLKTQNQHALGGQSPMLQSL